MIRIKKERLSEIFNQAQQKKVIVFGDLMVDEYLWGDVTRISPEAPVPIINISSAQLRFGGAANVALNLSSLGQIPLLVGLVGDDRMGNHFLEMLRKQGLPTDGILTLPDRSTTVKTRIIGNNQHIARVDQETVDPVSTEIQEKLFEIFIKNADSTSAILIQDYNKGVVVPPLVRHIIDLANRQEKIVTVDPKFENFFEFKNSTLFKPNTKEVEEALAIRIRDDNDVITAGKKLLSRLNCQAILITLGSKGMALLENSGESIFVETRARTVADVSGAGDTVIATLTFALTGGANMKEAVTLSNFAAGQVCEEVGVVPVNREKLKLSVLKSRKDL